MYSLRRPIDTSLAEASSLSPEDQQVGQNLPEDREDEEDEEEPVQEPTAAS